MRRWPWGILLIALAALALPPGVALWSRSAAQANAHACGDACECTVQNSCGCIEEAPEGPDQSPQAPAPQRVKLFEMALDRAPRNQMSVFLVAAAPMMIAPTQRRNGERASGRRVHDALAAKGVWRT